MTLAIITDTNAPKNQSRESPTKIARKLLLITSFF